MGKNFPRARRVSWGESHSPLYHIQHFQDVTYTSVYLPPSVSSLVEKTRLFRRRLTASLIPHSPFPHLCGFLLSSKVTMPLPQGQLLHWSQEPTPWPLIHNSALSSSLFPISFFTVFMLSPPLFTFFPLCVSVVLYKLLDVQKAIKLPCNHEVAKWKLSVCRRESFFPIGAQNRLLNCLAWAFQLYKRCHAALQSSCANSLSDQPHMNTCFLLASRALGISHTLVFANGREMESHCFLSLFTCDLEHLFFKNFFS